MVQQKHDMSQEKQPNIKKLLPEGILTMVIESCEPSVSKAGNHMMIVGLHNEEEKYTEKVYLVAEQGKRWQLKQLLTACGIEAGKDNVYDWDTEDIIGKKVKVTNEHEDNTWINRDGNEITTKQNRFTDFEQLAWDE
jgi:hypothetical protein